MHKPIKRLESLKPLSRDHHHGLLLCWKIRQGLQNNVNPERIKSYADWFWQTHLRPHFEIEEKHVFTLLPDDDVNKIRAIKEHRKIQRLFEKSADLIKNLNRMEEELVKHIRFEERVLFNQIQEIATVEQLHIIENIHSGKFEDNLEDEFWK